MQPPERHRFKQETTLAERLAADTKILQEKVGALPPGLERDELLKRARQNEAAVHMTAWPAPPGLQQPT